MYGASGDGDFTSAIWRTRRRRLSVPDAPPEDVVDMGVDYDGNFVRSGGMRNPAGLDGRSKYAVPAGRER